MYLEIQCLLVSESHIYLKCIILSLQLAIAAVMLFSFIEKTSAYSFIKLVVSFKIIGFQL